MRKCPPWYVRLDVIQRVQKKRTERHKCDRSKPLRPGHSTEKREFAFHDHHLHYLEMHSTDHRIHNSTFSFLLTNHNKDAVRKHDGDLVRSGENHRWTQQCRDAYDRVVCESIEQIAGIERRIIRLYTEMNEWTHWRMHMNHRPIVPVRNAADIAYRNVTARSRQANASMLSCLVAREIYREKEFRHWLETDCFWITWNGAPERMAKRISLSSARVSRMRSMPSANSCWCADARSHDSWLLRVRDRNICSTRSWLRWIVPLIRRLPQ